MHDRTVKVVETPAGLYTDTVQYVFGNSGDLISFAIRSVLLLFVCLPAYFFRHFSVSSMTYWNVKNEF